MKTIFPLTALLLAPPALPAAEPITNSVGMKLVRIDPGTFTMGQDGPPVSGADKMAMHHTEFRSADWDEKPAHRATITQPFHMSVTEVTLGQFRAFEPDFRKGKGADDEAVNAITWDARGVLRVALEERRQDLSPADGGGVGVCVPRGHDDALPHGRHVARRASEVVRRTGVARTVFPRWQDAARVCLAGRAAFAPRRAKNAERLGPARHARQYGRVVRRLVWAV